MFGLANGEPLAFAGLWERWKAPEGDIIESCTILTTDANELLEPIHDRMPVILKPEDYYLWLDPKMKKVELVKPLLQPFPPDQMAGYPVSEKVNKTDHEGPVCVRPVGSEP